MINQASSPGSVSYCFWKKVYKHPIEMKPPSSHLVDDAANFSERTHPPPVRFSVFVYFRFLKFTKAFLSPVY